MCIFCDRVTHYCHLQTLKQIHLLEFQQNSFEILCEAPHKLSHQLLSVFTIYQTNETLSLLSPNPVEGFLEKLLI